MYSEHHGFREQYAFFTWVILLILSIITGLYVLEGSENRRFVENQRRSVVEQLSTIRVRLEGELNAELFLARSLITEVVLNTDITEDRFSKIAHHFMESSSHIKNIGLAKGTILEFVYPVKGNEKAIGLDYTKNASQWPAVKRVIEGRKTVVAGPLDLMQGGVAIIGRTPIFVDNGNIGSDIKEYFGILSVVINVPSMFEKAGLNGKDSMLKISIRGKDGLGVEGDIFYGSEDTFANDPVLMGVVLPGGSWLMAAIPANGWEKVSPFVAYYRIIAMSIGLVILTLLFIQHREVSSRKKVEEERKKLIIELKNALADVKQLGGLLPICTNCKKIRDDKGYWNKIEEYIEGHSDASFSHSICSDCSDKLYGDEDWYIEMKKETSNE